MEKQIRLAERIASSLITLKDWLSGPLAWMLVGGVIVWMYGTTQEKRHSTSASPQQVARATYKATRPYPVTRAQVMHVEGGETIVLQVPVPSALSEVSTTKTCIVFRDLITSSSSISCEQDGDFQLQDDQ